MKSDIKPLKLFLMGPQGSGKGTQAELLSIDFHIPTIGMGQLIRDEIASGSENGQKLKDIVRSGKLVSEQDAVSLLQQRLQQSDAARGYILDGYPRNSAQYQAFSFDRPTHVFVIEISREESLSRIHDRLTCSICGKVGSKREGLQAGDACACGGVWQHREDDTPKAIAHRLEIYERETTPVIEAYEREGIVRRIDGMGTVADVHDRIVEEIKKV